MRASWKRFRYRLEWLALVAAMKLVPLLPLAVCAILARFLGAAAYAIDHRARRVALSNLECAFGSRFSAKDRETIARRSFQSFARTMLELFWSTNLSAANLSRYIEFENLAGAQALAAKGAFIATLPHYGNWEWLGAACALCVKPGTVIMQEFKNSLLDPIFKRLRELPGHEFIPQERGVLKLYRALRKGSPIALLIDLTLPPREGAVVIDCFGLKASLTAAHVWLSKQTGAPIMVAHCQPLPEGRYRIVFHPAIYPTADMTDQQVAQQCWDIVQLTIEKDPAPWLWMYKHWRYRPSGDGQPYPFYAQTSPRFDKLIAAPDRPDHQGNPA